MTAELCVAFDAPDRQRTLELADAVAGSVDIFKVGLTAFVSLGGDIVLELARRKPVFLDLKLHDIPAQVEGAARAAAGLGARYMTVHASGGKEMVAAAVRAAGEATILGVTVLTSLSGDDLFKMGIEGGPRAAVLRLAEGALAGGAGGLVCSPLEVAAIRERFGARAEGGPILVVPGIRNAPAGDDQQRTLDAASTVAAGADILVVGRPITAAADPGAAAAELMEVCAA